MLLDELGSDDGMSRQHGKLGEHVGGCEACVVGGSASHKEDFASAVEEGGHQLQILFLQSEGVSETERLLTNLLEHKMRITLLLRHLRRPVDRLRLP